MLMEFEWFMSKGPSNIEYRIAMNETSIQQRDLHLGFWYERTVQVSKSVGQLDCNYLVSYLTFEHSSTLMQEECTIHCWNEGL